MVAAAHDHTQWHSHSVGLPWKRVRPDAETSTWQHTTLTTDRHPCPRRDSSPQSHPASGRRTHALDLTATGIVAFFYCDSHFVSSVYLHLVTSVFVNLLFSFEFTLLKCHLHSIDTILILNFLVHSSLLHNEVTSLDQLRMDKNSIAVGYSL